MHGKQGQLVWDELIPWIIALAVIVLVVIIYFILSGKVGGALQYLKTIFRT